MHEYSCWGVRILVLQMLLPALQASYPPIPPPNEVGGTTGVLERGSGDSAEGSPIARASAAASGGGRKGKGEEGDSRGTRGKGECGSVGMETSPVGVKCMMRRESCAGNEGGDGIEGELEGEGEERARVCMERSGRNSLVRTPVARAEEVAHFQAALGISNMEQEVCPPTPSHPHRHTAPPLHQITNHRIGSSTPPLHEYGNLLLPLPLQ